MNLVAAFGVLATTLTLVVASVVFRAGKARPENRLYAALALLTSVQGVFWHLQAPHAESHPVLHYCPYVTGSLQAIVSSLLIVFSYCYPRARPVPWTVTAVASGLGLFSAAMLFVVPGGQPFACSGWLITAAAAISLALIANQLRAGESLRPNRLEWTALTGTILARVAAGWVLSVRTEAAGQGGELLGPQTLVILALLTEVPMLFLGAVLLKTQRMGLRALVRDGAGPLLFAAMLSAYAGIVLGLSSWLHRMLGAEGTVLAAVAPPLFVAWVIWTWHEQLDRASAFLDPQRRARRELVERVLAVTGRVGDPEAVLAMIRASVLELLPEVEVDFRRVSSLRLLPGVSPTLSPELEQALTETEEPFVLVSALVQRHRGLRPQWTRPGRRVLVPVRREGRLYGAFELAVRGRIDGDDMLTVSALADHLAVKLENLQLYSSLGRAGRELASVRGLMEDLIESLPVGIVGLVGPELRVRLWNPAEARRTGISKEEALGKRYLEDIAAAHIGPSIAQALRKGTREVLHYPNVGWPTAVEGSSVDLTIAPLRSHDLQGEQGYVLILVDTTERNALQRELEEIRRLAALGQFAAAVAHDIRTPLSSIRMSVQILRGKVELPPEDMEYFDLTLEAISRLNKDLDELLDFTKPALLRIEDVDVADLLNDVQKSVSAGASEQEVSIQLDIAQSLTVPVDEGRMRQTLVALVENALQVSHEGQCIRLGARQDGDFVLLTVVDEGPGIAAELLDRIWDPFFSTRPDGTGLGLAIARKTLTAHGGTIQVRSRMGKGTCFELRLPASRATEVLVPLSELQSCPPPAKAVNS